MLKLLLRRSGTKNSKPTVSKPAVAGEIAQGELWLNNNHDSPGLFARADDDSLIDFGRKIVLASETAPANPKADDLWYDSVGGRTYIWYEDGSSSQWVDVAPQGGGGGGTPTKIEVGNTKAEVVDTGTDGHFEVVTEGTERLRVDQDGRLLVGTSSARANFFNSTGSPLAQVEGTGGESGISLTRNSNNQSPANLIFGKSRGTALGSNTVVTSGDILGRVSFEGSDGTEFVDGAVIEAYVDGTPGANSMPGRLVFSTTAAGAATATERMRIDSRGQVVTQANGIATTDCLFTTVAGASVNALASFRRSATLGSIASGTEVCRIARDGNVTNVNNSYGAISDVKLKENIVDAGSQWDDLKALQVRKYNLKEGPTHTQIGLVAQEAELVSPGLVSESPDRDAEGNDLGTVTKSVNYSVLYMKAVKALQEAMERIETLEAANTALAARLTKLEGGTH